MSKRIIVGLDFGATYSGIAANLIKPRVLPGSEDVTEDVIELIQATKILTVLRVNAQSNELEFGPIRMPGEKQFRHFKLALMGLDSVLDTEHNLAIGCNLIHDFKNSETDLSSAKIVSIYLKGLWDMVVNSDSFKVQMAQSSPPPVHAVVTWPSSWEEETLARLKEAVAMAGIVSATNNQVLYRTEHEAAMKSILFYQHDFCLELYKGGHSVIVVDCGGITTDGATYQFGPVTDAQAPTGRIVDHESQITGALAVDAAFLQLVSREIKKATGLCGKELTPELLRDKNAAWSRWLKETKLFFEAATLAMGQVQFKIGNKAATIHRDEMIKIFDDVINPIINIILKLFKAARQKGNIPKVLFLTGGFGCNRQVQLRVRNLLQQHLGSEAPSLFIQNNKLTWTAVCREGSVTRFVNFLDLYSRPVPLVPAVYYPTDPVYTLDLFHMARLKKIVLGLASLAFWRAEAGPCKPSDATTTETASTTTTSATSTPPPPSYTCQRRGSFTRRAEDAQALRARVVAPVCGYTGVLNDPAVVLDTSESISDMLDCAALCAQSDQCRSILFDAGDSTCQRLKNPVYSAGFAQSSVPEKIYDLSCFECNADGTAS
ncbi:hypothetical protein QQX98_002272 [Neonectria punicea]|uniref:Apple domain-containing protein n=1 Tax=Neonectria punicea TaxID=979145 RepID=A0ABR1HJJ6_9HYPO